MHNAPNLPTTNQILSALPAADYQRLAPHLENFELNHARVLYEIGARVDYVYFPISAMVSLVTENVRRQDCRSRSGRQ